ncbi:Membrane-associated phospholipid phosphatase [Rubellimicrobium mesophilum DSM 19309]|uniref:Membrane-associated phospholipid phosphatase n=1 Tax=Rubellimicrobium mesophilum DSM 19309 TaxID=442562 RepID=A0A017HTJ6_9RHOB|nr:phosphatase PAP2 family protein [Rubellimicrobium mesophilum]EYD77837.1 Membrane-associated phospholipid phosphatase [Rubellimicrobium mesophilum DSM 19309]
MPPLRPLLARIETRTLLAVLLIAAALWTFGGIAEEMAEGDTHAIDTALLLALRVPGDPDDPLGPPAVETAMRDITALGGITVLALVTAAVVGALAIRGQRRSAAFLAVAVGSGQLLSHVAKSFFDRPRPDLVPHATEVLSSSFPSGHSMMAAVTWLTLAVMLARAEPKRRMKVYWVTLAALVTVAVGVSRVYLGVHWPSDVAAGWTLGAAWALLCALVARWLERKGEIEPERGGQP